MTKRFCRICGTRLSQEKIGRGFSSDTGEKQYIVRERCPKISFFNLKGHDSYWLKPDSNKRYLILGDE